MVQINFSLKEVNCKAVYYGPGLSGKTTNLEVVHAKAPAASVGELTSIATEGDRTLFFDFLPLNLGQVAGMKTKFQIYTVPGQVYYNSTRKLVLQGSDGVVFVADSKRGKMDENLESLANLEENLAEFGMDIDSIPIVLQYNKRDLPEVYSVEEMNKALNRWNAPYFEAVARDGTGVFPTLKQLAAMVLESLNTQHGAPMASTAMARSGGTAQAVAGGGSARGAGGGDSATAVADPPATPTRGGGTSSPRVSMHAGTARSTGPGTAQRGAAAAPASESRKSSSRSRRPLIIVGALLLAAAATFLAMAVLG